MTNLIDKERADDVLDILGARAAVKSTYAAGGQLILDQTVPPGNHAPVHFHDDEDEAFLVLEGEVLFTANGEERRLREGEFIFLPRGTRHSYHNQSGKDARMIVLGTPGRKLEAFFRELDATARRQPLDGALVTRLAAQYDITID